MQEDREYSYSGFKNRGGVTSRRPQIRAKVFHSGRQDQMTCLIDSGSDHTIINAEYAAVLGIDLAAIRPIDMGGVVEEGIQGYPADVMFEFDDFPERIPMRARFVYGMSIDVLLGQNDFFENFKVRFEKRRGKFYLQRETNI